MRKHYTIDIIGKEAEKNPLKIGSVVHTEKAKNERINELLEGGWKRENIAVRVYIQD